MSGPQSSTFFWLPQFCEGIALPGSLQSLTFAGFFDFTVQQPAKFDV